MEFAVIAELVVIAAALVAAAAFDARRRIIPNACVCAVLAAHALGTAARVLAGADAGAEAAASAAGALAVLAALLAPALLARAQGRAAGGIGGGDIKLLTALGAAFGWVAGLAIVGLTCVLAALVGSARGMRTVALAPFIALACAFVGLLWAGGIASPISG